MVASAQSVPTVPFLNPRKRCHSSCASDSAPKKRKLHSVIFTSQFWDGLSQVPLTKNALRELDRRHKPNRKGCFDQVIQHDRRRRSRRVAEKDPRPIAVDGILETLSSDGYRELKRFASHGGPVLADLRGYCAPISVMSFRQSSLGRRKRGSLSKSITPKTTSTRSTGPYDRAFQQHLIDHRVFTDGYEYPDGGAPPELEGIEEMLDMLASCPSPLHLSHDDFRKFKRADNNASKERQVTTSVIPMIEGGVSDDKCVAGEIPFTNLQPLTDGTLVPGNPDLYYGSRPEQLDRRIRKQLSDLIVPSTQEDLPILPNLFVEVKGPDGSAAVAKRQLTYDMSLGARGILEAECYDKPALIFDNRARAIGCIYHDGTLKMYACHLIPPLTPGTQPGYVTTQLKAWALTSDLEAFRQGTAAYRNGRDWAKQQRDKVIQRMNKLIAKIRGQGLVSASASATSKISDPDSSADELGLDFKSTKRSKMCDSRRDSESRDKENWSVAKEGTQEL